MRLTFVNLWVVIYGLGIVWYAQPLVIVPAVFAALAANGVRAWSLRLHSHGFVGTARQVHTLVVGAALVTALVGLVSTATATATRYVNMATTEVHLRDTPLATFFLITAVCAWRALMRPSPRRTTTIAFFVYVTWLPFILWNALQSLGDVPSQPADAQYLVSRIALAVLLASGAFVCWVATLATPHEANPAPARLVGTPCGSAARPGRAGTCDRR